MLPCLKGDTLVDAAGVVEVWQPCLVCKAYIRVSTYTVPNLYRAKLIPCQMEKHLFAVANCMCNCGTDAYGCYCIPPRR